MLCYKVRNDQLPDARRHPHCTEKTAEIMPTSSVLTSYERTDLKYEIAVHNYLRKVESEKCF